MGEQGHEGDEIIFLALKQIDCKIADDVKTVGQLGAEALVEVIARSLWLISNGEIKFSVQLPPNIASRHRICTNMATKVKELGFTGDCGYNQLLYPVESQTRILLTWIVQRLPRSEEERAEEVLGANALLNKSIITSLQKWRQVQWRLPQCSAGTPLRNIYECAPLRTVGSSILNEPDIRYVYRACSDTMIAVESSIFEKHSLELLREAVYASRLENDLNDLDSSEGVSGSRKGRDANLIATIVKDAFSAARQSSGMGALGSSGKRADQLSKSLQDLVQSISNETDASSSSRSKIERGTRFTHASEFAQELKASLGTNNGSNAFNAAASAAGLDAEDFAIRKVRMEEEEKARQEELDALRSELQVSQSNFEALERRQGNASSKIRQWESELAALLSEGENLEREITIKRKTLEMLPSATENISKLQGICGGSAKRLLQLAQEWETHRRPLLEKLRDIKDSKTQRRNKCRQMVEEMKKCREEMTGMIQDLKDKQVRAQSLADEMSKLPKNINRALYTHRIMDIIASIGKQNKDIAKITGDIRDIQKTINNSTLTLQRADAVAEELIYSVRCVWACVFSHPPNSHVRFCVS